MRTLAIFGSTGSIGTQALQVAATLPAEFRVGCLAAGHNVAALAEQALTWQPERVVIGNSEKLLELKARLSSRFRGEILAGPEGLVEAAKKPDYDCVLAAMSGFQGLPVAVAALTAGHRLALANKESMVAAGPLLRRLALEHRTQIVPVDSEHSALFQCLQTGKASEVETLLLTGSGGPFRTRDRQTWSSITPDEAARHPTWSMGRKISIDSATMMNKALEIVEARELFGVEADRIDVVVHPQSIVHSMVVWRDGSIVAQMGLPDMKVPIRYAMTWPERLAANEPAWSVTRFSGLEFFAPDRAQFPSLDFGFDAAKRGGTAGAVLNAANEAAVDLFLQGDIAFPDIFDLVGQVLARHREEPISTLDIVWEADRWAREETMACSRI